MLTAVVVFFFFQAEDGIRDLTVTGVQTCALPISLEWRPYVRDGILEWNRGFEEGGIRNAIQVLDAPDDTLWSAEDARYSTVRWMANNAFTYADRKSTRLNSSHSQISYAVFCLKKK